MLSFDIRSLEHHAARVEGELPASDPTWEEGDVRPVGAVRVSGRLSSAGPGRFYFSGHMEGTAGAPCRRCLEDVTAPVKADLHLLLVDGGGNDAADLVGRRLVVLIPRRFRQAHVAGLTQHMINGRNAILGGFQGQRQWTDHFPNGDFLEAILSSSFVG